MIITVEIELGSLDFEALDLIRSDSPCWLIAMRSNPKISEIAKKLYFYGLIRKNEKKRLNFSLTAKGLEVHSAMSKELWGEL